MKAEFTPVTVRKASWPYPVMLILLTALPIVGGVLSLTTKFIPQYIALSICLFGVAVIAPIFFVGYFLFRVTLCGSTIAIRAWGKAEKVYSFADISWCFVSPKSRRSAIRLLHKQKQVAVIFFGAKNFVRLTELRHFGKLTEEDRRLLDRLK